jgi:hypothetical protein
MKVAAPAAITPVRLILLHARHSTNEFWPRNVILDRRELRIDLSGELASVLNLKFTVSPIGWGMSDSSSL